MEKGTILIIDDEEKLRKLLARLIELEGYHVLQAPNAQKGLQILAQESAILLVISDVKLPDANGIELLGKIKTQFPLCEVIVITAYGTIQDGVKAMKLGAFDYITKGDGDEQILVTVEKAADKARLNQKVVQLESKIAQLGGNKQFSFQHILGESKAIKQAIYLAQKVAMTDSSVLIEGETGTGKELFAQAIHQASPRKDQHFVAVNCSAFPKDLLESEMFGHKKGAFTGATFDKKGLFEEAHNGTLFLDEIGEMNPDLQAKLLRVLESKNFIKTGETKPTFVNVRIIAATNRNLLQEIEKEHFRSDLYYRLSVFKIDVPSLRERKEDIALLAQHFLKYYCKLLNKSSIGFEKEVMDKLKNYTWKGNIRELRNVIERAVILAENDVITSDLLPSAMLLTPAKQGAEDSHFSLQEIEKAHILKILAQTNGNKTEAAKLLNIGLTTLYRKLEE
ncbi:MAG: sigma-54-dependent Fis family transcriptional regulator [Cytophagales bacterium]|nr:MAG: sigma-54-dependent Fis family transcriptional regulator [Cytophagales bacterium]